MYCMYKKSRISYMGRFGAARVNLKLKTSLSLLSIILLRIHYYVYLFIFIRRIFCKSYNSTEIPVNYPR